MAASRVSKSRALKMKPLSYAEKVRRDQLVAWLRTYKSDDPERARFIREKHKHLEINILDEEAYEKAMEDERRANPRFTPVKLVAETPEQRQLQASGEPFSLHAWFEAGPDVIETDSKCGGPTPAPREDLAVLSKMPKSELNSGYDSGVKLQSSPRKSHSEKESGSKATSSIFKGSENNSSVQNNSVAPKEPKLSPGEKNQSSPATQNGGSTHRKGHAAIKKTAAPKSLLAAPEKAERQERNPSAASEPDRKFDQAPTKLSPQPQKTFTETESVVVPESVRSVPRGAEHKGSLMAQAELERKNKRAQEKLQRERERAQDKLNLRKARAQMKAFPTPRFSFIKTEQPMVPMSRLDAPVKREPSEGSRSSLPKAFAKTEKPAVPASGLDAPVKRERDEGSCPAPPKAFVKTEKPVVPTSRLDAPVKRERSEGSCDAPPKADPKPEQAQSNRSADTRKAFDDAEKAVALPYKTEQLVKVEVREIGRLLKTMTGFQERQAARIVESIVGAEYLQKYSLGIRMDLGHPLPRRAHDALLDFVRWGIAADSKKADALISRYKAAKPVSKPQPTSHVTGRKREETEKQVSSAERKGPAFASFKAPGMNRKRVGIEAPAPQKRKAEALASDPSIQEATSTLGMSTHGMKRMREEGEAPTSKKRRREEDEAPPPKKQKSQPASEKENAPRQLPRFVHRHIETASSDRNLTRVEDTLYGRRRIQDISHNVRAPAKSQN